MSTTNLHLLTKSHRAIGAKRRAKQNQIKEVVFDETARRDFLTGFHKRKVAKAEAAREKAKEKDKEERLESRRERRRLLREQALENAAQVEKAYNADSVDQDDDEWHGITESSPDEVAHDEEFENEETLATVTIVEDFDPDTLIHGHSHSHPEPLSELSRPSHSDHDTTAPRSHPALPTTKPKAKPTKVRYETKDARKREQVRQRARRTEKAERAGGKASRKLPRGTKGKHGSKR